MHKKPDHLKWYIQMGVDETIEENPINRFEMLTPEVITIVKPAAKVNTIHQKAPILAEEVRPNIGNPASAMQNTRKIADGCGKLDELRSAVYNFTDLSIAKTATNTVFADGNPDAQIMLIGEAPGAEEDAQGIPFCGASGKLLDQMLSCIGLIRQDNFYISNTIFWRPPGNRRPTPEELAICLPYVEKHISLVKPKLIVLVGGTATSLLDSTLGITKMRGNFFEYNNQYLDKPIPTTAIFHPSYLLRSPGQKRLAWKDLLMLKEYITNNGIKL